MKKLEFVWKCRECGREYPENTRTGTGENELSVYRNPSGIVARSCHDHPDTPVDLVPVIPVGIEDTTDEPTDN